ncbi:MAG TPA: hypothetical protein VKT73_13250 [Xanthobacteraceae bacterium]|nr:hypothetical protein [Xanthobacteraceae bacterium]
MTSDLVIALLRTFLQMAGIALAAKPGLVTQDAWTQFSNEVVQLAGLAISAGSFVWMLVARWNTKSVPAA